MTTTHSDLLVKAKHMCPNMPEEVFMAWLSPIIMDHNSWPYDSIRSPHPSSQWSKYFGLYSLSDISNCLWHRSNFLDMNCLDPISNSTIKALIENHVYNFDATGCFNVRNSKIRFFGFVELIKRTGRIPAPIIGINAEGGLRILDGNHRLSALTHIGVRGSISCETWVGAPNIEYNITNSFTRH